MIPKQDRQGVRQAREIEKKYNLNTDFSEIEKLANDANRAATSANTKANGAMSLVSSVSQSVNALADEINALKNGVMQSTVYDPQGKAQDIFAYVDAAITGAIEGSY